MASGQRQLHIPTITITSSGIGSNLLSPMGGFEPTSLPNAPPQPSTPSVVNQLFSFNLVVDGFSSGGGGASIPLHGHSRAGSRGSSKSSVSHSSRNSPRFSPSSFINPAEHLGSPPPPGPGVTPVPSQMGQITSPARPSPPCLVPTNNLDIDPAPNTTVSAPPDATSSTSSANRSPSQPSNLRANVGESGSNNRHEGATPEPRVFGIRSPLPPDSRPMSPPDLRGIRNPSEHGFNGSGYFSPRSRSLNQIRPTASPQQRPSGSGPYIDWQSLQLPPMCSPVTPGSSWSSLESPVIPSPDPSGLRHAIPTSPRQVLPSANSDLPRIDSSFGYPGGGQYPHSHSRYSQPPTHHSPASVAFTPANGNGRVNGDINSVVNDLGGILPTSLTWQTDQGVLSWTPHPAVPGFGLDALEDGGRSGNGNSSGGRDGNVELSPSGYPMPKTWTPEPWPPTATSTPVISRRVSIQLAPWMVPDPYNAALPHIEWDISREPSTANLITSKGIAGSVRGALDKIVTYPAAERLVIGCQVGIVEKVWGPIKVRASGPGGVTTRDAFNAIYEYFQRTVKKSGLARMKELPEGERLEENMKEAFYRRTRGMPVLPGHDEALKRLDCLGERSFFWGLYVSYNDDGTWQLNLGLVNRCA